MSGVAMNLFRSFRFRSDLLPAVTFPPKDPIKDPSERSQFRALCFRHSSARIGHALAKASVRPCTLAARALPRARRLSIAKS